MSVGKQAGKGFISYLFRNVLEKLIGVIAMVFLARKLTPYDFGLVSITEVLLSLISVLGTTGLAEFLLAYRKEDVDDIFKASFWFNIIITVGIVILFFVFVPFWSVWQHDEKIRNISWVVGAIFIFSQLQTIPKAWLSKNLQFDKQVKVQTPFIILVPIAKIIAVFAGLGVYSLILPTLVFQPILTFLLYKSTPIRPGMQLHIHRWKEIYHFTKHLIGATVFTRITDQGDKFILAKFLGLGMLGAYNIAFQLAELFTSQLVQVSNNVLSSVLPKYAHDKEKFYKHYMSFLKTFSFFMFPFLSIMFIAAKPIILFLYGNKWVDAIMPLKVLIVVAAFRAVSSSYGAVMNSFHLNKKSFIVSAIYAPFHIAASAIGSMYGVAGLASGVGIVKITFINWSLKQVMDAVSRPFIEWYKDMSPFFIVNLLLCILMSIPLLFISPQFNPIFTILFTATFFVVAYVIIFKFIYFKETREIGHFIDNTLPKLSPYYNKIFRA